MGNFGGAMGNTLGSIFYDQPPRTMLTDPRTGYIRGQEARDIGLRDAYARQYADMLSDPTMGMGVDPAGAKYTEQQLVDATYNRLGAAGAGGSGTARAAASKAIVDYRLGLMKNREQAMQNLRAMMTPRPEGTPYTVTPVQGQESMIKSVIGDVAGSVGGMAVGGV